MANCNSQRRVGVMQGRLSPPMNGKIQAFPWDSWEREFQLAATAGAGAIEFIVEADRWRDNPLLSPDGREVIARLCQRHGVSVDTLCLDYFMAVSLWGEGADDHPSRSELLRLLIPIAASLGVAVLNVPLLGASLIEDLESRRKALDVLARLAPVLEQAGLKMALETSLTPHPLHEFLHQLAHPVFGINYDTGNSAYFGYSIAAEMTEYAHHIYSVHIKDCRRAQPSVRLGTGETDFDSFFSALSNLEYRGPIVLQSARTGVDPVEDVREQVQFVRGWMVQYPIRSRDIDSRMSRAT